MPDTLFHFLFPIIATLAARVHLKHPIRNILLAGLLAVLIDVDHLSIIGLSRLLFHNVFITILLPALLVFYAFYRKKSYEFKGFSILLLVFLASHPFLDMGFGGGVGWFYPFSTTRYRIDFNLSVAEGLLVSTASIWLAVYFLIILIPAYFLDEIIEVMERKHESFRRALKDLK